MSEEGTGKASSQALSKQVTRSIQSKDMLKRTKATLVVLGAAPTHTYIYIIPIQAHTHKTERIRIDQNTYRHTALGETYTHIYVHRKREREMR